MEQAIFLIFILSFVIQLFYFVLFSRIISYKEKEIGKEAKSVSVIIAAHNEKKNLQRLIPLLLNQKCSSFEIIVADDRSTDGSQAFLQSVSDSRIKVIKITNTPEGFNSKKFALSQAIEIAAYEILLFTDADCIPLSENWISQMAAGINNEKQIVLGYSGYEKRRGCLNLFIRYETFYTAIQYFS
ncbi:MAG: glycosyltransferase, partial [Cytophagaceae bacterium]|nr:glycosyltransferase [Cytophagaceae bacterium]